MHVCPLASAINNGITVYTVINNNNYGTAIIEGALEIFFLKDIQPNTDGIKGGGKWKKKNNSTINNEILKFILGVTALLQLQLLWVHTT